MLVNNKRRVANINPFQDHPDVPAVHSHLQQSKDAANNANREVTDAEQLYNNARTEAEVAVDVIVNQTRREKVHGCERSRRGLFPFTNSLRRAHAPERERERERERGFLLLHIYIHFCYQFFETRPEHLQKRDVISSYRFKGQAQPEDVVALQFDVQTWTEHLISLNAKFSRLNNAMRLEVADSFVEIFSSMRELQASQNYFKTGLTKTGCF
jgi:hypothetical protein